MKKHPLLAAGAAAGTAVLGAAYAVYRVAFYQKPTTKVPSPADMPTRECYSKAMGPDADALARDMFKAVHITAQDGTPLAARYYHHADGAPLAIIFHGYRGYAERDGLGGYTLCTALGYNVLLPDQRAHGYSGGHTITMGVKERYDARDWTVWARSRFGPEVPIFLMGVSMGAATVLLAAGLNLPDNVCGIVADCADGQAADLVALLPFGRHDDNADVAVTAADRLAEAQAVHARQHNIQKCRVAAFPAVHQLQRALGTGGFDDLPAGHFQVQSYHFADAGFVFDYQNSFHKPDFPFCINLIPAAPCSG